MRSQPVVTIRDVAREARVAVSTVSRVLNGTGYTSAGSRDRVLATAARLGYRPSITARSLRRARSMTVGVLVSDLLNPVFLKLLRGAEHAAARHGYTLLICDGQASPETQAVQLARLYDHRVDGLLLAGRLLAPEALRPFLDAGIPVAPQASIRHGRIAVERDRSEVAGGRAAIEYLVALGHRRIALIGRRPLGASSAPGFPDRRLHAIGAALKEHGIPFDRSLVVEAEDPEECRAVVQQLTLDSRPATAFLAGTHLIAAPLLTAIYDAGLRIPDDVSFVSYGDSDWALAHRPPLSVVRHDYYAEAVARVEALIGQIERWPEIPPAPELDTEFVVRGSCGPPPTAEHGRG